MRNKVNKAIGLLRKLQNTLPRPRLLTIYKSIIRSHLDYGDIIYDQVYSVSIQQKHLKRNFLKSLAWNLCNNGVESYAESGGAESYDAFIKFWKTNLQNIFLV